MADYYPLIAKAIAALNPNTQEARQGIYERARTALSRQLASIDPPPSSAIVDRELTALEAVIRRVEQESAISAAAMREPEAAVATSSIQDVTDDPVALSPPRAPARPQAPTPNARKPNRKPIYAVIGALGIVAVAAIGTLAYLRRNEPPAVSSQRVATPAPRAQQPAKTDDRVGPGQSDRPVAQSETSAQPAPSQPVPTPAQAPAPVPPAPPPVVPSQAPLAVANRLIMAMEGTDRPENVVVRQGSVVWRTELVSGAQGQPPQLSIRAFLDAPEARMRGEITILRNRDPAFPASHTIQVQFTPGANSEFGAVRNLSQIELRQTENQAGYPLAGQGIAVTENLFLLALAQFEPALSRNIEMLRARPIVFLEFQGASNRRGAIVLEKGISGQQVFDEAFRSWQ